MDIYEIKVLLAVHVGNEELVLKNAGGKKLADSNDYFVVTDDGICHLLSVNGKEKDVSIETELVEGMVSRDIKKIVISSGVTSIRDYAFAGYDRLTSVTIPDSVTSIGDYAFYNCDSLTSVRIGNSLTSIGESAFSYCNGLTSVTIPNSVTSIGHWAFYDCHDLTSVVIGNGVTSIGFDAFDGCNKLTSLSFKGKTLEEVKAMDNYPFGIEDESVIKCIDEVHAAA